MAEPKCPLALSADQKNGPGLLEPHLPNAGSWCSRYARRTACELDLVLNAARSPNRAQTLDAEQLPEQCRCDNDMTLDPKIPMWANIGILPESGRLWARPTTASDIDHDLTEVGVGLLAPEGFARSSNGKCFRPARVYIPRRR